MENNLFESDAEAIVCSFRVNGGLYGKTSMGLLELLGPKLQEEISACLKKKDVKCLPLGGAISLDASKIAPTHKFKRIIFAALWGERENNYTSNLVYIVIANSLREAFKYNLYSVVFPILKLNKDTINPCVRIDIFLAKRHHILDKLRFCQPQYFLPQKIVGALTLYAIWLWKAKRCGTV